jgi:hypothetical protein
MPPVLCLVDGPASREAVGAAVEFCRKHGSELELLGVVKDKRGRLRRGVKVRAAQFHAVRLELQRMEAAALGASEPVRVAIRVGDPIVELLREAADIAAVELFLFQTQSGLRAAVGGGSRGELVHVSLHTTQWPTVQLAAGRGQTEEVGRHLGRLWRNLPRGVNAHGQLSDKDVNVVAGIDSA